MGKRKAAATKAPQLQGIMKQTRQTRRSSARQRPAQAQPELDVLLQRDTLHSVLKFLAPKDLAVCSQVCSFWLDVATSTPLWKPHCEDLWRDKLYVPVKQLALSGSQTYARAYALSLRDAQRVRLTAKDLCAFRWQFRFKLEAGSFFVDHDPFWTGHGTTMKRYFQPDGSLTCDVGDPFFSQHEDRWKFTKTKIGKFGSGQYVKVCHWPSLEISRDPTNWSMILENEWVVYQSIDLL